MIEETKETKKIIIQDILIVSAANKISIRSSMMFVKVAME